MSTAAAQTSAPQVVPVTVFFDANWQVTEKPEAAFIRVGKLDTLAHTFHGTVTDYYVSGAPLMQVAYVANIKEGVFSLYYSTKQLAQQGIFLNDKRAGAWNYFYPDGKPWQTLEFLDDNFKVINYYDSTGQQLVKEGTGAWQNSLQAKVGAKNVSMQVSGNWADGKKVGTWFATQPTGEKVFEEEFENGSLVKGKVYDQTSGKMVYQYKDKEQEKVMPLGFLAQAEAFSPSDRFFTKGRALDYILRKEYLLPPAETTSVLADEDKVERMPEFPGGHKAMFQYLSNKFRFPENFKKVDMNKTVVVTMVLDKRGKVQDVTIVKSVDPILDAEVVRVVQAMPLWQPGYINGLPVNVKYTIPYRIVIQ
ncbi:energy transducer TonB [Rufibacter sp. LB8]|uniref:energy transducer TonB n=1 Tax=Rufibacter sp. LB8 TaxID=2777781 RepID=UPI00178C225D|nr:energy transducer TonB [Rufibacter sp. LB8]